MKPRLATFLKRHIPQAEDTAVWGGGLFPLQIHSYLSNELPPLEYISSVRSLVFQANLILVLSNPDGDHIIPGGRCEEGESLEEALCREVLEETGWRIDGVALLGFMHFHHLAPMPSGYKYPHPDFIQVIYMAEALEFVPEARISGDYELISVFRSIAEVQILGLSSSEQFYLDTALEVRVR